jgi:hypothetical protein
MVKDKKCFRCREIKSITDFYVDHKNQNDWLTKYCIKCYEKEGKPERNMHPPLRRHCLKCDKPFFARTRWIRICDTCKGNDTWKDNVDIYEY